MNQRVVLEIVLVERHRRGFFPAGRLGSAFAGLRRGRGGGRGLGRLRCADGGRLVFNEFDLGVRVTQLGQLGLEQGMIAGIVHQTEVILKFGIETDGQDTLGKGNRVRVEQVSPGELAHPADGLDELCPQSR